MASNTIQSGIDSVGVRATSSSGATYGNAAIVVFENVDYDTVGGYDSTTGIYTVSQPGLYEIDTVIQASAASLTAGAIYAITINKNSDQVFYSDNFRVSVSAIQELVLRQRARLMCVAGDTISIETNFPAGVVLAAFDVLNQLEIVRIP